LLGVILLLTLGSTAEIGNRPLVGRRPGDLAGLTLGSSCTDFP